MLISDITPPKTRKKEKPKRKLSLRIFSVFTVTLLVIELLIASLLSSQPEKVKATSSWLEGYDYRTSIDIKGSTTELTNFQVKLTIQGNDKQQSNYIDFQKVGDNGKDVRFTDKDRTTKIPYWIQSWDDTQKTATIWIKIPTIPTSGTTIYMYYGKASATLKSNFNNTFTKDYEESGLAALYHMDEGSGTTTDDSSANNNDATLKAAGEPAWLGSDGGQWDGRPDITFSTGDSLTFDGQDDYLSASNSSSLNITDNITIESWVKGSAADFSAAKRTTSSYGKYTPQLQVVGSKIYYAWYEYDGSKTQIWTASMDTDGTDWEADQRRTNAYNKYAPQFQVVGTKIYYVWYEHDGSDYQIWTASMDTDGTDWDDQQMTTSASGKYKPQLQVVGSKIYYIWYSGSQIWTATMDTDGTDWDDQQMTTRAYTKLTPQLQVVGSKIYYAWSEDDGSKDQIWTATMDTDGTDWDDQQMTTSAYDKYAPQFQVVGTKIYYIWHENDGSKNQIWTAEMDTDGADWSATKRTTNAYNTAYPQLQVVGSKIYYIWREFDASSRYQIWIATMDTDRTDWSATKMTTSSYDKDYPQLQVVGTKIYYVWNENDGSKKQIWTAEMYSNLLNKGDFYGLGLVEGKVRGFINAGIDSLKYKAEAISDTAGATVEADIDTSWNHVVLAYDKTNLKLYINGELKDTTPYTQNIRTNDFPLVLGDDLDGTLDETRIYSRVLSQDEITAHYQRRKYADTESTTTVAAVYGYKKIFKGVTNTIFADGSVMYSSDPDLSDEIPISSFSITPSKGSIEVTIFYWFTSGTHYKKWKENGSDPDITTTHVVGDLAPNTSYPVKVDGVLFGKYTSNSSGQISFVYDLGYSDKIFEVGEPPDLIPTGNNISYLIYILPITFLLIGFTLYFKLSSSKSFLKMERE